MEIEFGKVLKIYTFYVSDRYEVTVRYDGNKMNIIKIDCCYYDENKGIDIEAYSKVNYVRKVKDKDNLENEMKKFIGDRMDKMIDKLDHYLLNIGIN